MCKHISHSYTYQELECPDVYLLVVRSQFLHVHHNESQVCKHISYSYTYQELECPDVYLLVIRSKFLLVFITMRVSVQAHAYT